MKSRKYRNQKGFTLIELLAVITILAIIMLFAASSVTSALNKSQRRAFIIDAEKIVEAAKGAYTEALDNKMTGAETVFCMSTNYLKNHGMEKNGEISGSILVDVSEKTASYTIWLSNGALELNGVKMSDLTEDSAQQFSSNVSTTCNGAGKLFDDQVLDSNNNQQNSSSNGNQSNSSNSNHSQNKDSDNNEVLKSDDNTLKSIIIDGKSVAVKETITYETVNDKIDVQVETNSETATYEIRNNTNLLHGNNKVLIVVKAESGATKRYQINVSREKTLSSDTGIRVFVNNEEVQFDHYKGIISVSSSTKTVNVDYFLNNSNARADVTELGELQAGDNELKIKVTAVNGEEQEYVIIVRKESKKISLFTVLLYILLSIFGIYLLIKIVRRS